MEEVFAESVHLVITSPPYWQLKDYDVKDQIGFHDSYEEYINNLNLVWMECHRVLHGGCRLCINIGDQFARSVYYGRYKVIPIRTEIIKFCESAGFDYMGAIIWQKTTTCNTTGGATIMGSYPHPRNGIIKIDYEFILLFKKPGKPPVVSKEIKEQCRLSPKEWNQYFAGHWNFPGEKQKDHLAAFPEELPRRLIRMFSFVGETVLDPFLGSGTTSLAAKDLGRSSVGYEINESFLPVIERKLGVDQRDIFRQADIDVEVIRPKRAIIDHRRDTKNIPYIFHDPVRFDKKADFKGPGFGSKIKAKGDIKIEYLRLKRVLSPNVIRLTKNITIRLLGVKPEAGRENEAMGWLRDKLKGKGVYLRHEETRYDENNHLLSYLYLKNKTFINMHLLRTGLVEIDHSFPFAYHKKFLAIQRENLAREKQGVDIKDEKNAVPPDTEMPLFSEHVPQPVDPLIPDDQGHGQVS